MHNLFKDKFYIVSYWGINDGRTITGGIRPYKLYHFLKGKGIDAEILTPVSNEGHEIIVKENWFLRNIKKVLSLIPPDFTWLWSISVYFSLKKIHNGNHFYVLTTSPPYGLNYVGVLLKLFKVDCTWITDFRDPFTQYVQGRPVLYKRLVNPYLKKMFFKQADIITHITDFYTDINKLELPFIEKKIITMRNGVDTLLENKSNGSMNFVYSGSTYRGEATRELNKFISKLNKGTGLKIEVDFYGEEDSDIDDIDGFHYKTRVTPDKTYSIISNYKFGLVYLQKGGENSGYFNQKFIDYLGTGIIPIIIRPSKEMVKVLEELDTGIMVFDHLNFNEKELGAELAKAEFNNSDKLNSLTRAYQFQKLIDFIISNK